MAPKQPWDPARSVQPAQPLWLDTDTEAHLTLHFSSYEMGTYHFGAHVAVEMMGVLVETNGYECVSVLSK